MATIDDRRRLNSARPYRGDKPWRARYYGPDGKLRSQSFAKRSDAEAWITAQTSGLQRGEWADPQLGRIKFSDWVERWEAGIVDLRPRTKILNVGVARNYLVPRFGEFPLDRITTSDVKAMLAEEMQVTEGRLSNSAIRRHVLVLRTILDEAVGEGLVTKNTAKGIKLPPEDAREMRFLEPDEVVALADAIGPHFRPMVLSAAYVGLRFGELAGLRLRNVDLLRHKIKVEEQLAEIHGQLVFGPPKTKAGVRSVTMPATLTGILGAHFATPPVQTSQLAFPGPMGGPLRAPSFRKAWRRACAAAGFEEDGHPLQGLVFHELRHTSAALAIAEGAHPMAIKERLGHASITTTLDRYGALFPRLDETLADALDGVLSASLSTNPKTKNKTSALRITGTKGSH